MSNKEILEYFNLIDEDDTEEDIEEFEGLEIENEEGDRVLLTIDDLKKAMDEGKSFEDLLLVKE
jgi:hypothetical protein